MLLHEENVRRLAVEWQAAEHRGIGDNCAFCNRTPARDDDESIIAMIQKLINAGYAEAMTVMRGGSMYRNGQLGLEKDDTMAVELWTDAADRGSFTALFYDLGRSTSMVRELHKMKQKGKSHWILGAASNEGGCAVLSSRWSLGMTEYCFKGNHLSARSTCSYQPKWGAKIRWTISRTFERMDSKKN